MDNVTSITTAGNPKKHAAERIEEQRVRIFRAMNLVGTTVLSLGQDHDLDDQRGTLEAARDPG
jgi:hypothetical protein